MSTSPTLVIQNPMAALTDSVRRSPFMRVQFKTTCPYLNPSSICRAVPQARCGLATRDEYTPETDAVMREVYRSASMFRLKSIKVAAARPASWRPEVPIFGASTLRGNATKKHSRPIIAYGMLSVDGPRQSGHSQALGQTERTGWQCSI